MYARYYIQDTLQDPAPDGEQWSLESALGCFESFYVLEALPQRWSQCHLFKCNCPECFKTASCVHCILASMVCNPAIRVPATCLGATIQGRRRRGRPCARGSDVSDVAEARSRERLELGMEYRMPKVSMSMLLTCFVYFLSACIQQEPFAAEIIESDDDFAWLRSVMETRAADWFERYWCGPIQGRWLLANGGIAITTSASCSVSNT